MQTVVTTASAVGDVVTTVADGAVGLSKVRSGFSVARCSHHNPLRSFDNDVLVKPWDMISLPVKAVLACTTMPCNALK